MVIYGAFLGDWGPGVGSLGSQMVDLGCQDTDWVGGRNKDVLEGIILRGGLILATERGQRKLWLSMVHFWVIGALEWVP